MRRKIVFLLLCIISIYIFESCGKEKESTSKPEDSNVEKYNVSLEIDFEKNLIMAKYDVILYADSNKITTMKHGNDYSNVIQLTKGKHVLKFVSKDDKDIETKYDLQVDGNMNFKCGILNHMDNIEIKKPKITSEKNNEDTGEPSITDEPLVSPTLEPTITNTPTPKPTPSPTITPQIVSYATVDRKTAQKGETGMYAYKNRGGTYDVYFIIDMDEGYVYNFANIDSSADKVKINGGTLRTYITVTWHEDNTEWTWGLHYKWADNPEHLIIQTDDGFEYDYYDANLEDALKELSKKKIINY